MSTKIEAYPDLSVLDNQTLDKIIDHEREAFGYRGYGEYAFCSNPACRRILSIDEVFGVRDTNRDYRPLEELEAGMCGLPDCPDCQSKTLRVFENDSVRPYLASLYRKAYGSLLFDEAGKVRGACVFQNMGLREFFTNNMDYKESFDWETFRRRCEEILEIDTSDDAPVVSTNRISIARPYRGGGTFHAMTKTTLNLKPENYDLPAFAAVRLDGNILPILRAVVLVIYVIVRGEIVEDEFGTVAIGLKKLWDGGEKFQGSFEDFAVSLGGNIRDTMIDLVRRKKSTEKPKYYKGMTLLDDLQHAAETKGVQTESYNQTEITPELIAELSDVFRELFCTEYGQYVFYPSEGKAISPQQLFGTDEFVNLEQLDGLNFADYPHPETGESPVFWHHPDIVPQRLSHLSQNGQLAIIRNPDSGGMDAFTFGYHATVTEAFENEEWHNPFQYSGFEDPKRVRDISKFLASLNEAIRNNREVFGEMDPLSEEGMVYVWNQIGVIPSARRTGKMRQLTSTFFEQLKHRGELPVVGLSEVPVNSLIHGIVREAGAVDIRGALTSPEGKDNHDITLIIYPLKSFIDFFTQKN